MEEKEVKKINNNYTISPRLLERLQCDHSEIKCKFFIIHNVES